MVQWSCLNEPWKVLVCYCSSLTFSLQIIFIPGSESPQVWPEPFRDRVKRFSSVGASERNYAAKCRHNAAEMPHNPNDKTQHWLMDGKKNSSSPSFIFKWLYQKETVHKDTLNKTLQFIFLHQREISKKDNLVLTSLQYFLHTIFFYCYSLAVVTGQYTVHYTVLFVFH